MAYDLSDYVDVAERVQKFHEAYPNGSLQSDWRIVELDGKQTLVVKAYAYRDADDKKPGIGHATEPVPGLTKFTKGSELMVGETSAWGRALAALGFEVKRGIASREEVQNREGVNGGGADDSLSTQSPTTAAVGFASKKQQTFFDRLLKKRGMDSNQVEAVNRFAETLPTERISKALDGLNDDDKADKTAAALLGMTVEWSAKQSDVPYDKDA